MQNKLIPIALFALFFAPMLIAVLLHSEWVDWRAAPEKAHGELLAPVVPVADFSVSDAGGTKRSLDDLRDRWQLVYITRQACREECLQTAMLMHNIRLAQDRRQDQVGLVMLSDQQLDPSRYRRLRDIDPSWQVFDGDAGGALIDTFPNPEDGAFYIIDPEANIMERFDPGADLNGVRKDLDRLLTWTVRE